MKLRESERHNLLMESTMKKNSKSNRAARTSSKQRKRKCGKRDNQVKRIKQPESIFDGVKSKDELKQIVADLQQSGRKFLVSLITIVATKNWEELGHKNAKSFLKANVPHIKYHTAMSWFHSNQIIARLAGPEFIGVYSMNAMRVFAPLDSEQQEALWEALTKEWKQENETEKPIDAVWLTRAKVLEVKSMLFPSAEKQNQPLDKMPQPSVLAKHPTEEDESDEEDEFDDSDVYDCKKPTQPADDEDVPDNESDDEQDDNAFDIEKPSMNEQRLSRVKRFKRHLDRYDGSEVFALYVISWMVREYHENHPSLDKLLARAVRDELHKLAELEANAEEEDDEA